MADVAVENNETSVVEKVAAEEVDAKADATVEEAASTTENGTAAATDAAAVENGDATAAAETAEAAATTTAADADEAAATAAAGEENGDDAANGDSTDSAPAEAVKRKVTEGGEANAAGETVATPEKKAKLDEAATKEDVQNGAEASEVAA